jgi:aryl-alcohol dehydrogenase-like predicted oxidoreductase
LVHAAIESGIDIFDTADVYGEGESERALARALGSKRNEVIIATKAGHKAPSSRLRRILTRRRHPEPDYSPDYIERCIVASLRRLNTDYVDVFLLHSPPTDYAADSELFERLESFKQKGYCRLTGVSAFEPEDAPSFLGRVDCVQFAVNARKAATADSALSKCAKSGVGVIARQPLDHGQISAPAAVTDAIRFAAKKPVSTVLCGMGSIEHIQANVEAVRGLENE